MTDASGVSGVAEEGDKLTFFKEEKEVFRLLEYHHFLNDHSAMKAVIDIVSQSMTIPDHSTISTCESQHQFDHCHPPFNPSHSTSLHRTVTIPPCIPRVRVQCIFHYDNIVTWYGMKKHGVQGMLLDKA